MMSLYEGYMTVIKTEKSILVVTNTLITCNKLDTLKVKVDIYNCYNT